MISNLRLRLFAHSWRSDWNHGNAHFLRGLAYELANLGHKIRCYEEDKSWSFVNLLQESTAKQSLRQFEDCFPNLDLQLYSQKNFDQFAEIELRDADVVIVHEWNTPQVVHTILSLKRRYGFRVLFHDTHHRAYTNPQQIAKFKINEFDGVLAFGDPIQRIYQDVFKAARSWTFHEAADTAHFFPKYGRRRTDVNWVGNWGDDERTAELREFLIAPLAALREHKSSVYGVRYPDIAKVQLEAAGIQYRGYLPNLAAPSVYARSLLTLHIPRRCYTNGLSGIPTIRMFEAFACGVPLICSPWRDIEHLFRTSQDYISVPDGASMKAEIAWLLRDELARRQIALNALETIQRRHTCMHRAQQLTEICEELGK